MSWAFFLLYPFSVQSPSTPVALPSLCSRLPKQCPAPYTFPLSGETSSLLMVIVRYIMGHYYCFLSGPLDPFYTSAHDLPKTNLIISLPCSYLSETPHLRLIWKFLKGAPLALGDSCPMHYRMLNISMPSLPTLLSALPFPTPRGSSAFP